MESLERLFRYQARIIVSLFVGHCISTPDGVLYTVSIEDGLGRTWIPSVVIFTIIIR